MNFGQTRAMTNNRQMIQSNVSLIVVFILLSFVFLFFYRETVSYLMNDWTQWKNGDYAHGFVVLLVAAFMIWGRRDVLEQTTNRPDILAVVLVCSFSLSWMIGTLLGIRVVESLSFFLLVPSVIYALAGRQFVTQLWFPLAFILIAFPVWELFLPYLQSIAASISFLFLKITGTTALREGAYIMVPAGKFLVAEGCSGLRYLLAAMTFAGFFIYLEQLTKWRAAAFFGIAFIAAIIANALRITTVIIAGNMTQMQHPWVHDHLMLGWYIFAAMLVPVFWLGNRIGDAEQKVKKEIVIRKPDYSNKKLTTYSVILPVVIIALITGPLLKTVLLERAEASLDNLPELTTPVGQGGWYLTSKNAVKSLEPVYEGADIVLDQFYSDGAEQVRLYIASYLYQKQDKELINVNNYLYNEEYWQPKSQQIISPANDDNPLVEVRLKNNAGDEKLIWYWYKTAGQSTTLPIVTKFLDLYGMITGKTASSVIMISVDKSERFDTARSALNDFHANMVRQVNAKLDDLNNP